MKNLTIGGFPAEIRAENPQNTDLECVAFEVLTTVIMKSTIFWHITPSSPKKATDFSEEHIATCFHAGFLLGLFFDTENGGEMFLRNVGCLSTDYMALYPRKWYSSLEPYR
jgi:hypothetical protein